MSLLSLRFSGLAAGMVMSISQVMANDSSAILEIVADQVRSQGFACSSPVSAEKVEAESQPDQAVYILTCDGVKYHVHLIPDQAAQIQAIK